MGARRQAAAFRRARRKAVFYLDAGDGDRYQALPMGLTTPPATQAGSGSTAESRAAFFRQGSWLVLATGLSGVLMMATQFVAQVWSDQGEYLLWLALLRVYLLFGIPSIGLQTIFAQQAAVAVTADQKANVAAGIRSVLGASLVFWVILAAGIYLGQGFWLRLFRIPDPAALWATLSIGLVCLWSPVLRGVVQGQQQFLLLGLALLLDGAGRFVFILLVPRWGGTAAVGMSGALLGQILALALCGWAARRVLDLRGGRFVWGPWLRHLIALTFGLGTLVVMSTGDVTLVRAVFDKDLQRYYLPASLVGLALMTFATPVAAVMFPKVARSAALHGRSRAMPLALGLTLGVGALAAAACTVFPELPLRIIFFRTPENWVAAPLVPWFAWALLPLMIATVLVNNLLAQSRFGVVPWVAVVGMIYVGTLAWLRGPLLEVVDPLNSFRILLAAVGACNTLLLGVAAVFTLRSPVPNGISPTSL